MTHLECNPQMQENISQWGGLQFHESEIEMGLPQSNLFSLSKSFQTTKSSHPRRVLPGLRLQPQIRYPAAQRPSPTKNQHPPQNSSPHLWCKHDRGSDGHLGGGWLSVLGPLQGPFTPMAALGRQALGALGPNTKAAFVDQSRHHRPPAQAQKAPTQKKTLRAHQTRHLAQTPYPHQNRFLERSHPRLYRNRSGLSFGKLCFGRVHSLAQCHRHPLHLGGK